MIHGGGRFRCFWCDRIVRIVVHIFVNGHGWTATCARCEQVHEDGRA